MIQLKAGIPPSSLNQSRKSSDRRKNQVAKKKNGGVHFERVFSDAAISPFDQTEWERRTAEITDDSGRVIFKQDNIEVPKSWSALATKIAVAKLPSANWCIASLERSPIGGWRTVILRTRRRRKSFMTN